MALRLTDNFDSYVTADILDRWFSYANCSISSGTGRDSSASLLMSSISGTSSLYRHIDSQATWVVGFAFRTTAAAAKIIFSLLDSTTTQCSLVQNADGTLSVV